MSGRSWDIFCKVVDNYGDVGVCWRLARQLANERGPYGESVRLWVDALEALGRIWPDIDPHALRQHCAGVDVWRWIAGVSPASDVIPHDVVIEAFGCETPDVFVAAMTNRDPPPVWINLEYLSAEAWVDDCHLLPSPHPRLPLVKHFFFPGFSTRTGGLLREADLLSRRDAFGRDDDAQARWWRSLGVEPSRAALKVSLFSYSNPAAEKLLRAWAHGDRDVVCVVAEGVLRPEIERALGAIPAAREAIVRDRLTLAIAPFVPQSAYDEMLWACDLNFVRGEDTFVRAQWAARPLVWQIYPQKDGAHRPKLDAFVDRYGGALDPAITPSIRQMFNAWNGDGDIVDAWSASRAILPAWTEGAKHWARALAEGDDLMTSLARAIEEML